jgi:hypothetical protein
MWKKRLVVCKTEPLILANLNGKLQEFHTASWKLGNILGFAWRRRKTKKACVKTAGSQELPDA